MARPRKHQWERTPESWLIRVRLRVAGKDVDKRVRAPLDSSVRDRERILAAAIEEIEKEQEQAGARIPSSITLVSYAKQWLAARAAKIRPRVAETYATQIGRYLLPAPGLQSRLAAEITRRDVAAWADWIVTQMRSDRDEPLSHDWITGCWRTAKQLLRDMAADLAIADPTARVRAPSGKRKHVRETGTLTACDAQSVIRWALEQPEERRAAEIVFMISTGVRAGEMYALRTADVDWNRAVAIIRQSVSFTTEHLFEGGTKTNNVRDVPLTPDLQTTLRAHLANLADHSSRADVHPGGPLVFPAPELNKFETWHRRGNSLYKVLARAEAELGLAVRLRPQVFRRTSARLWAKVDPKLAKSVHGWVTDEMVDHYGEPAADEKADAARRIWSEALPIANAEG